MGMPKANILEYTILYLRCGGIDSFPKAYLSEDLFGYPGLDVDLFSICGEDAADD